MKKAALYERAERMYVAGDMTYEEIASQLDTAERTLRNWAQEGKWAEQRATFRKQRDSLDAKLYEFTDKLMASVLKDWDSGQQVDPGRLFALTRLIDKLEKARKFESETRQAAKSAEQEQREASSDAIKAKVEELLGIR